MAGEAAHRAHSMVAAMAEAGVMFLLFNLGLHFSLGRIRAEAGNIFGFGALQMLIAGGASAALFAALGLVEPRLVSMLVTAIAISLALTPAISNIGRKLAGRLRSGPPDSKLSGDDALVLIIGLTPAGRAVADALAFNDIGYLALEPDHDRFQTALADGYHVHRANPADPRSWDAIGMGRREVVVVATGNLAVSRDLTPLVKQRLPDIERVIALPGPEAVDEFNTLGMVPVDTSIEGGHERLVDLVFTALDRERKLSSPSWAGEERLNAAA
ncbi:MAG: cation:proton antiporter [Erythrobacteraceae bacterium]|jgi:CPA2 family monovalent cation:H+ antiporter-2|nr:cation:proton antiporter [Erythrobacteraceae bacterium]